MTVSFCEELGVNMSIWNEVSVARYTGAIEVRGLDLVLPSITRNWLYRLGTETMDPVLLPHLIHPEPYFQDHKF